MVLTDEMKKVMGLIENTNDNMFVTGKAGTGKTTFLKYLIKHTTKKCVIAAPTGIAAINAGGVTLHSMFGLPFKPITPTERLEYRFTEKKSEMLLQLEVLIIDEVSMVRPDVLDTVDGKLRWVRESKEPFGGVQVIMFGDLYQLPPVAKKEDKELLDEFYDNYYFFNAVVWKKTFFHVIELSKVFRQTDIEFVGILNHIRNYMVTSEELDVLSELKDRKKAKDFNTDYIHICTHKRDVEKINTEMLGEPTHTFDYTMDGKFPESSIPCPLHLQLRVGARVMTIVNNPADGYYNGTIGNIVEIGNDEITVQLDNSKRKVKVKKNKWVNNEFVLEDGEIVAKEIGSCTQYPLTLAWAITIHKSQGLTFDKAVLHLSKTFCPGQLYVALSRCRTLDGIVLDGYITKRMVITDYALTDFERTYLENGGLYGTKIES
jgi:ATP-dependent exoDNAse (exonuclease V) alpha subunit